MATKLYDAAWIGQTIQRMAAHILRDPVQGAGRALVGVRTRGAAIADRLAETLRQSGVEVPVGYIDATLHRDDLHTGAGLRDMQGSDIPFDLNDRAVVLVDDVIYSGRTTRAALDALFAYGRPACVRYCVMIDRGGRELPIQPDIHGVRLDVPKGAFVRLKLQEVDNREDAIYIVGVGEEEP